MGSKIENIRYEEEFILNSRGMKIFTCSWLPENDETKALIFLCHGYGMECSISMKDIANRLANEGFGVHGIDYEGHGKSDGLDGFIQEFDNVIKDCADHFRGVCEKEENVGKMRFLLGESMGGATVLLLHRNHPQYWDGAILVAPMCKIQDEVKPHPMVTSVLSTLIPIIPTWRIVPGKDIIDVAFRDPRIRQEIRYNQYCYKGRTRLQTASQLMAVSLDLEKRLNEVSLPFLLLHGQDDKVTDPSVSKLLYEQASSSDKTFNLYPGMWHALVHGELPENEQIVFADIVKWLDQKVENSRSKHDGKLANDGLHKAESSKTEMLKVIL